MKIGVFHPGTQHSWLVARAFDEGNVLSWYITSVFYKEKSYPYKLIQYLPLNLQNKLKKELRKRYYPHITIDLIHEGALLEWFKTLFIRLKWKSISRKTHVFAVKAFSKKVAKKLVNDPVDILWGFDCCSLEVFENPASKGVFKVLDFTTIHPKEQNDILKLLNVSGKLILHTDIWIDRVNRECELADLILVGSDFAKETLVKHGVEVLKIKVLQYPYDDSLFKTNEIVKSSEKIKFIFVGSLKITKGVLLIIDAFKRIPEGLAELTFVGHETEEINIDKYNTLNNIKFKGALNREQIHKVLQEHDCLILPTYFDGGGIVMYEAAASGLAIIQSQNCGDGVRNDNGIVVKSQTVDAYYEAMMFMIKSGNIDGYKANSLHHCHERSFTSYSKMINDTVKDVI